MDTRRSDAQHHLVPHFTRPGVWRSDELPILVRGEGSYVWDSDGNRWLDGLSGLFCVNIGHGRSDLAAAAMKQAETLAFATNWGYAHPPAIEAATLIAQHAPGDLNEVFFVSSGSEAVESALKFARTYHLARGEASRYKVIARHWSYHGTTLGALAVTGIPHFRDPFAPMLWDGVRHVPHTLGQVVPEGGRVADLACVRAIEETILAEGPETVSMIIAEPVQNGRGAVVPPEGYWQELRRIADTYGVLLCADEVINSFGRLGHWFGSERFGVVPDMITFAKGVTSAYAPLGGVVIRTPLLETIWDSQQMGWFVHGSTFGGHPVSTAVAVVNMRAYDEEQIFANVLANEGYLGDLLRGLQAAHRCVKDVRGTGYFWAVELMADRDAGTELTDEQHAALRGGRLLQLIRDSKMLIRPDDRGATFMAISPPLVADRTVLDDLAGRLDQVLGGVDAFLGRR